MSRTGRIFLAIAAPLLVHLGLMSVLHDMYWPDEQEKLATGQAMAQLGPMVVGIWIVVRGFETIPQRIIAGVAYFVVMTILFVYIGLWTRGTL